MHYLGMFDELIEEMVETVWEQYVQKLIYSAEDHHTLLKVQTDKFAERTIRIGIKKEVEMTKKPDPQMVFG